MVPRILKTGLTLGVFPVLAGLAGCADQPVQTAAVTKPAVTSPPSAEGEAKAAALVRERGRRLDPQEYRELVLGNTLYRPLANGTETLIYLAPDGAEKLRISAPDGRSVTDSGKQTFEGNTACWQWQRAAGGKRLCFEYYWNGRILTMVDSSNQAQPAQFLVQKGNIRNL